MKKSFVIVSMVGVVSLLLMSCGDTKDKPGPTGVDTTAVLDLTVVGDWEGMMASIPALKFNGAKIFVDISKTDSVFSLVTLNPAKDTTEYPAIKDTTLVLEGGWKLNTKKDSILLICDSGRIIDTTLNILSPRDVKGQVIPMAIKISENPSTTDIEWEVALTDLVPLAPMLGMDLSIFSPSLLQVVKIILIKRRQ